MPGNVLNCGRAAETGVQVVRAFLRLRQMLASNAERAWKLEALESECATHVQNSFDVRVWTRIGAFNRRRQVAADVSPL